jgi:hypothetical protein
MPSKDWAIWEVAVNRKHQIQKQLLRHSSNPLGKHPRFKLAAICHPQVCIAVAF